MPCNCDSLFARASECASKHEGFASPGVNRGWCIPCVKNGVGPAMRDCDIVAGFVADVRQNVPVTVGTSDSPGGAYSFELGLADRRQFRDSVGSLLSAGVSAVGRFLSNFRGFAGFNSLKDRNECADDSYKGRSPCRDVSMHDSSPSVGVVVGPPNPTEGEARKGFVRRGGNRE